MTATTGRMRTKKAAGTGRMYVIGDPDTGVLFVKTNPLRVALVPLKNIQRYANEDQISLEDAFGRVAKGSQGQIVTANGGDPNDDDPDDPALLVFKELATNGSVVSDALFCFIAEVDNDDWSTDRYRSSPIVPVAKAIAPTNTPQNGDDVFEIELEDTN